MSFKKIVGFGDSWMWGDELLDPALSTHPISNPSMVENTEYREHHCFLGQLGTHYNVPVENFGIPGGSLQSTIWSYIRWLENKPNDCLVLVALTSAWRDSFYDAKNKQFVHNTCINSQDTEWNTAMKQLLVLSDCVDARNLNYKQAVWFFDGQSQSLPLLQFCSATPPCVSLAKSLLWPTQSLQHLLKKEHYAPNKHPNEYGHTLITNNLISYIDSCTM